MAAPSVVGHVNSATTNTTTHTATLPSGMQSGDYMVMFLNTYHASIQPAMSVTGWTAVTGNQLIDVGANASAMRMFVKAYNGSETTASCSTNFESLRMSSTVYAIRGTTGTYSWDRENITGTQPTLTVTPSWSSNENLTMVAVASITSFGWSNAWDLPWVEGSGDSSGTIAHDTFYAPYHGTTTPNDGAQANTSTWNYEIQMIVWEPSSGAGGSIPTLDTLYAYGTSQTVNSSNYSQPVQFDQNGRAWAMVWDTDVNDVNMRYSDNGGTTWSTPTNPAHVVGSSVPDRWNLDSNGGIYIYDAQHASYGGVSGTTVTWDTRFQIDSTTTDSDGWGFYYNSAPWMITQHGRSIDNDNRVEAYERTGADTWTSRGSDWVGDTPRGCPGVILPDGEPPVYVCTMDDTSGVDNLCWFPHNNGIGNNSDTTVAGPGSLELATFHHTPGTRSGHFTFNNNWVEVFYDEFGNYRAHLNRTWIGSVCLPQIGQGFVRYVAQDQHGYYQMYERTAADNYQTANIVGDLGSYWINATGTVSPVAISTVDPTGTYTIIAFADSAGNGTWKTYGIADAGTPISATSPGEAWGIVM